MLPRCRRFPYTTLFCLFAALLAMAPAAAEDPEVLFYYEPHTGFWDVFDVDNPGIYATPDIPPHDFVTSRTRAGSITWAVTYQDVINNSGFGFDDPTFGAARRATFVEVLDYVSSVLNENPDTAIEVHWDASLNQPGASTLARMGTFYFLENAFSSGIAHKHITTGQDPPGAEGTVDISGQVNFGRKWNSETDDPAGDEFDLFSVLLHEVTHGLGVSSLLTSSGISTITDSNPGKYSVLNRHMALDDGGTVGTGSATALFNASAQFIGNTANLVSNRVVYTGSNTVASFGSNPQIFAPNPFQSGSSLSHWDFTTGSAVMLPSIAAGAQRRTYLPFEVANLVDLGYPNAATLADPDNIYVDFGGANGDGTQSSPFNNLADALAAVADSGTIHIEPGSSMETFTGGAAINQAVTLINETPGAGTVQIGVTP